MYTVSSKSKLRSLIMKSLSNGMILYMLVVYVIGFFEIVYMIFFYILDIEFLILLLDGVDTRPLSCFKRYKSDDMYIYSLR
jgi:hypothetical protein